MQAVSEFDPNNVRDLFPLIMPEDVLFKMDREQQVQDDIHLGEFKENVIRELVEYDVSTARVFATQISGDTVEITARIGRCAFQKLLNIGDYNPDRMKQRAGEIIKQLGLTTEPIKFNCCEYFDCTTYPKPQLVFNFYKK